MTQELRIIFCSKDWIDFLIFFKGHHPGRDKILTTEK